MVIIDFIVKRHGEKESIPGLVSSTPQDHSVSLSDKGRREEQRFGEEHIKAPPYYAHVIAIASDYVRTVETVELNVLGAGYDIDDGQKVTTMMRSDIGLGVNNHAQSAHPEMPKYGNEPEVLNAYVRTLFEKFWHARPGNPPNMAAYAAAMLDATAYAIKRAQILPLPDYARVLVEIVTHCPVIDAAAHVFSKGKSLEQGAFQTGEFFTGHYDPLGDRMEGLQFEIKGRTHRPFSTSDRVDASIVDTLRGMVDYYARDARTIVP